MIIVILAVWALDAFFLSWHWKTFFQEPPNRSERWLFLGVLIFYVFSSSGLLPYRIFSITLFVLLGTYLFSRRALERRSYRRTYYEDRQTLQPFLFLCTVGLLLKWFWGVMLLAMLIHLVYAIFPFGDLELVGASFLSFTGALWMVVLISRFSKDAPLFSFKDLLGLPKTKGSVLREWVLPAAFGAVIAYGAADFLMSRPDQPVTPFSEMMDWAKMSWAFGFFFCVAILAAPFLEEIIFRGFFFKMIQEWRGSRLAFWIVGSAFGILHMEQYWGDWVSIAIIFLLGFVLTAFRLRSGSTRPGIVMHYTFNFLMVIIPAMMFAAAHPALVKYYMNQERLPFEQKERLLQTSIAEDTDNATAYNELAWLYLDQGQLDKALVAVDQALADMPDRTIFQHTRSEILFKMGRVKEAVSLLERIHEKLPDNREIAQRLEEMKQGEQ